MLAQMWVTCVRINLIRAADIKLLLTSPLKCLNI